MEKVSRAWHGRLYLQLRRHRRCREDEGCVNKICLEEIPQEPGAALGQQCGHLVVFRELAEEAAHSTGRESTSEPTVSTVFRLQFARRFDRHDGGAGGDQLLGTGPKIISIILATRDDDRPASGVQNGRGWRRRKIRINDHADRGAALADIAGVEPGIIREDGSDSRQNRVGSSTLPMDHPQ